MINVLFVCLGNICRSPMAEAIFRHRLLEEGLEEVVTVDSAGTGGYHIGSSPHEGTREKLDEHNIPYDQLKARQVNDKDFTSFDYIITMDENNSEDLTKLSTFTDGKMFRMMDFVQDAKEKNVPDPYFTGDFDYTYELLAEACDAFLAYIKKNHHING